MGFSRNDCMGFTSRIAEEEGMRRVREGVYLGRKKTRDFGYSGANRACSSQLDSMLNAEINRRSNLRPLHQQLGGENTNCRACPQGRVSVIRRPCGRSVCNKDDALSLEPRRIEFQHCVEKSNFTSHADRRVSPRWLRFSFIGSSKTELCEFCPASPNGLVQNHSRCQDGSMRVLAIK